MNMCLGYIFFSNLRSFVFAGVILKYFGAGDQEAAWPPSAPLDQLKMFDFNLREVFTTLACFPLKM